MLKVRECCEQEESRMALGGGKLGHGRQERQRRSGVKYSQTFAFYACNQNSFSAFYKERPFEYQNNKINEKRWEGHNLRIKGSPLIE